MADDLERVSELDESDLRLVDAYFHELALDASEDVRPNTPDEQAADDELLAAMRAIADAVPLRSASRGRGRVRGIRPR